MRGRGRRRKGGWKEAGEMALAIENAVSLGAV
jgi:hypothetical protein